MSANEYKKQYQRGGRQPRHLVQLVQGLLLPAGGDANGRRRHTASIDGTGSLGRMGDGAPGRWLVLGSGQAHHAVHDIRAPTDDLP